MEDSKNRKGPLKTVLEEIKTDLWIEDQKAIDEGIEQLDKGKFVSLSDLKKEIKSRFNF